MTKNNSEQTNQYPDLVSIIIPVYNTGAFLKETLDSCLNQTYRNVEVLAMDDNSNDPETLEILKTYAQKDPRVKVFRSNENHGVIYGRNHGVEICQGKYFCFLDHDDILSEDCIGRLRDAILEYNCDMAECSFQAFADSDYAAYSDDYRLAYIQYHAKEFAERSFDVALYTRHEILKNHLLFGLTKLCWAKLFITEKYRKAGIKFENVRYGEDIDWSIRMFLSFERYVSVRFVGLHYRLHPGAGSMGVSNNFFKGMNDAWKRVYDMLEEKPELHFLIPDLVRDLKKYVYYSYRYILGFSTFEAKQEGIRYLVDLYQHCNIDLEHAMKDHCYDFEASIYWNVLSKALLDVPPEYLVLSMASLYDQDEPEMFYYLNLFDQMARQGPIFTLLTTDSNFSTMHLPQFKDMEQAIALQVNALHQNAFEEIQSANNKLSTQELAIQKAKAIHEASQKRYIDAPYNAMQTNIIKLTSNHLMNINYMDAEFIEKSLHNLLSAPYIQAIVLIGNDPTTVSLGRILKKTGIKLIHLLLNRDQAQTYHMLTTGYVIKETLNDTSDPATDSSAATASISATSASSAATAANSDSAAPGNDAQGQTIPSQHESWADLTTSLSQFGYLLPDYTRPQPDFSQRKYITFLHPDCEHGLAIFIKLIMLMKKRCPEQEFMLIQDQKNDLVAQLKRLHTAQGASLFDLKPDLSNLKTMQQPEEFSKLWPESKVMLMLAPNTNNCHGLTLESIYNYVPVLSTHFKDEAPLGSVNLEIPVSTYRDITCLPEDEELEPYVQALEQLLKQSPDDIKAQCDQQVADYQKTDHLKAWMDLFNSFVSPDKLRHKDLVHKPSFLRS